MRSRRSGRSAFCRLRRALAASLRAVIATGGESIADRRYLDQVWAPEPQAAPIVRRLDGVPTWPELAQVIRAARVYVGPDTSVTHPPPRPASARLRSTGRPIRAAGTLADRRTGRTLAGRRHDPAARKCLARSESVAMPSMPERRMRKADRQPQPLSRRAVAASGACCGRSGACECIAGKFEADHSADAATSARAFRRMTCGGCPKAPRKARRMRSRSAKPVCQAMTPNE
jgi:hypothetical protein